MIYTRTWMWFLLANFIDFLCHFMGVSWLLTWHNTVKNNLCFLGSRIFCLLTWEKNIFYICNTRCLFKSSDSIEMSVAKLEHTMRMWPLCCAVTWCFFCFCFLNREEDKNIFDYCRENNIDYVTKAIQSEKVDVNVTDEEVWRKRYSPSIF